MSACVEAGRWLRERRAHLICTAAMRKVISVCVVVLVLVEDPRGDSPERVSALHAKEGWRDKSRDGFPSAVFMGGLQVSNCR